MTEARQEPDRRGGQQPEDERAIASSDDPRHVTDYSGNARTCSSWAAS